MGCAAVAIELSTLEHQKPEAVDRVRKTGQVPAQRARIVLVSAAEHENKMIRDLAGADINTAGK